jgi:hypothetical protein
MIPLEREMRAVCRSSRRRAVGSAIMSMPLILAFMENLRLTSLQADKLTVLIFGCSLILFFAGLFGTAHGEYLGDLSANPFGPNSTANQFGGGNPFAPNSITNEFSPYGSPFSNKSANNPYATDAPKLYDQQGNYRGRLSANPYDPDSTSTPFGRYGSPFSPDSLNNRFGAVNPFLPDSPQNPFGSGWRIEGSR